jgi:hypothetical protein
MWAILLFGLVDLVAAGAFARRGQLQLLPLIGALSIAVLCSIGAGTLADLAAVGVHINDTPEWANSPKIHLLVLQGIAESMAPGIMGFSVLSLVALACALGFRRRAHDA